MSVDPYRQARAALVDGDVVPALSLLAASYGDPEVRIHATSTLAHETTVPRLPQVESWLEQDRENQDLWLLVGALQAEAAWSERGAARIAQTSEVQIDGLRHYMIRARESALIPLAHVEAYVELRSSDRLLTRVRAVFRYFSRRDVRQEVDMAADRLLAGADAYAAHPAFPDAHQAFAFVFDDRGDIDRARRHLELGGDEAIWPWGYLGDGDEVFERARTRAGLSHS